MAYTNHGLYFGTLDLLGSTVLKSYHPQVTVSSISHQMNVTQVTVLEIPNLVSAGIKLFEMGC